MQTITTAALKFEKDEHTGVVWLPRPNRHADIIHFCVYTLGIPKPITATQGFMTSEGDFVEREEAGKIAVASGQIKKLNHPPLLYTEDLW